MLALAGFAALCVTANAYNVGDIIEYGCYPQSKVTSSATITDLNAAAGPTDTWTSYGYYSGTGGFLSDGSMTAKDFMRYKGMTYGGAKYRGVYFSEKRTPQKSVKNRKTRDCRNSRQSRVFVFCYFKRPSCPRFRRAAGSVCFPAIRTACG